MDYTKNEDKISFTVRATHLPVVALASSVRKYLLFNGDTFCQVPWFVNVQTFVAGNIITEKL